MRAMVRHWTIRGFFAALVCVSCFLSACVRSSADSQAQPTLQHIDAFYGIHMLSLEHHITISPTGLLRSVQTQFSNREIRQGQLTSEQIADLAADFAVWPTLETKYDNVVDAAEIRIQYGSKTIVGGTGLPESVTNLNQKIHRLANAMPVVEK